MNKSIRLDSIVSSSDVSKKYTEVRTSVKEKGEVIILKNNKPDVVMLSFEYYTNLMEELEDLQIQKMITERYKNDSGIRYSHEEMMKKQREKRAKRKAEEQNTIVAHV